MQIAIKQSKAKFLKNYKQLKVPETSLTTSVFNSKLNQNEIDQQSTQSVNCAMHKAQAYEPSNLQNKQVSHDNQLNSFNLYKFLWAIAS